MIVRARRSLTERGLGLVSRGLTRGALIASSLASGRLFWVRACLGENQLRMHDCTPDGEISIGGVSEQLYGEGFIAAWHEVLGREVGAARLPAVLDEVGRRGGRWETARAIERGVWVPPLLRSLIGRPELLPRARESAVVRALLEETLRIVLRMIVTEGGWGVVETIDLRGTPLRITLRNLPEARRLGRAGRCVCHLACGITAGYFEVIFATPVRATESTCESRGDPVCTFELEVVEWSAPPSQ